jgi:hypothetical protein
MTTPTIPLAESYRAAVEDRDLAALERLYHEDALLDAHVPNWRFQATGRAEVARLTGTGLPGPGRFTSFRAEPTADGDLLLEFEWRQQVEHERGSMARQLHLLRLEQGRIAEQVLYCAGVWDAALQQRMAAEAPRVRPRRPRHGPSPGPTVGRDATSGSGDHP